MGTPGTREPTQPPTLLLQDGAPIAFWGRVANCLGLGSGGGDNGGDELMDGSRGTSGEFFAFWPRFRFAVCGFSTAGLSGLLLLALGSHPARVQKSFHLGSSTASQRGALESAGIEQMRSPLAGDGGDDSGGGGLGLARA